MKKNREEKMTLQEFIDKAKTKEDEKIKVVTLNVNDFGEVEFLRPQKDEIIDYTQTLMDMYVSDNATNDNMKIDYFELIKQSSKFVYNCCPLVREKSVRDLYPQNEFEDIPELIFGASEVIRLAGELYNIFSGAKKLEERVNDIKN